MWFVLSLLNEKITRTIRDARYAWDTCLRKHLEDADHEFKSKGYDLTIFRDELLVKNNYAG